MSELLIFPSISLDNNWHLNWIVSTCYAKLIEFLSLEGNLKQEFETNNLDQYHIKHLHDFLILISLILEGFMIIGIVIFAIIAVITFWLISIAEY